MKGPCGTTETRRLQRSTSAVGGLLPARIDSREKMKHAAVEVTELPAALSPTEITAVIPPPPAHNPRAPQRGLSRQQGAMLRDPIAPKYLHQYAPSQRGLVMRVVFVLRLRLRHHGAMAHLPPPSHLYLGLARQCGVAAAPQALHPPPLRQGVEHLLTHSGLHLGNSQHRIRAALLARGHHRLPGLGKGTDARGTETANLRVLRLLPSIVLVLPRHHPVFFALLTEGSLYTPIRRGETQSPWPNHLTNRKDRLRVLALPYPAPPLAPIQPMGKLVGMDAILSKRDKKKQGTRREKMIGQEGVAAVVIEEAVGEAHRGRRRHRHRPLQAMHLLMCSTLPSLLEDLVKTGPTRMSNGESLNPLQTT